MHASTHSITWVYSLSLSRAFATTTKETRLLARVVSRHHSPFAVSLLSQASVSPPRFCYNLSAPPFSSAAFALSSPSPSLLSFPSLSLSFCSRFPHFPIRPVCPLYSSLSSLRPVCPLLSLSLRLFPPRNHCQNASYLSRADFGRSLRRLVRLQEHELESVFELFDSNGNDLVEYKEFVQFLLLRGETAARQLATAEKFSRVRAQSLPLLSSTAGLVVIVVLFVVVVFVVVSVVVEVVVVRRRRRRVVVVVVASSSCRRGGLASSLCLNGEVAAVAPFAFFACACLSLGVCLGM
jgi:hypothetical protein